MSTAKAYKDSIKAHQAPNTMNVNTTITNVLNIGMDRSTGGTNAKGALMVALAQVGILPVTTNYHQSTTELTAVLQVDEDITDQQLHELCDLLSQEAIAIVRLPSGHGRLVGPKAEAWGAYDPARFLMPTGKPAFDQPERWMEVDGKWKLVPTHQAAK